MGIVNRPLLTGKNHPIISGKYLLSTNQIELLYEEVTRWLKNRAPGAIVYGRPRLGKTRAIKYLLHALTEEFNEAFPVFVYNCQHAKIPSEARFFQSLLVDLNHQDPFTGKADSKRYRLYKMLNDAGNKSTESRIVIIIDEAQELHEMEYGWLMDIYNYLERADINLTTILVGQAELISQRNAFIKTKKAQIVGRFMINDYRFTGAINSSDIQTCLLGYDEYSEYPIGSGFSFTRYFFPEEYDNGFRLSNYTELITECFRDFSNEVSRKNKFEIPMQYLTSSIERILLDYGVDGENIDKLSRNQVEQAIKYSGFIQAEVFSDIVPQ
ncbi:ATP-binding protein [Guptibacillus spartinae]|uniref:ATP-binding protein n=1 Tax=Guptibacillus spartinae TaxID=3025679 RepID=UPI00236160CB|nr:ATP-binding protein [Pseudalkalibacillus spartinae]